LYRRAPACYKSREESLAAKALVLVGRIATLLVGGITIIIGVLLVNSTKGGLFELMVTVFNLFVGPMLIPMLVGLLNRRVTWRGAAAGIGVGFICSFSLYCYKTFVLAKQPGVDPMWLRYTFEAISIFANAGVTIMAIVVTTLLEKPRAQEQAKIRTFFEQLDRPISAQEYAEEREDVVSPLAIIGWITIGIAVLLLGAACTVTNRSSQAIDVGMGAFLCAVGIGFHVLNRHLSRINKPTQILTHEGA
jgi:hypothetical protein